MFLDKIESSLMKRKGFNNIVVVYYRWYGDFFEKRNKKFFSHFND